MAYSLTIKYEDLKIPAASSIPAGALQFSFDGNTSEAKFEDIHEAQLSVTFQPEQADDDSVKAWLSNLLQKPLVISIVEVKLTQAKKGKGPDTEQVNLIAQATIDLMDFIISGESSRKATSRLHLISAPAAPSSHQSSTEDILSESEICITMAAPRSLFSEKVLGHAWNIMEFRCLNGYVPEDAMSKDDFMAMGVIGSNAVQFNDKDSEVGAVGNRTYKLRWNKEHTGIELEGAAEKHPSSGASQNLVDEDPIFGDFVGSVGRKEQHELETQLSKVTWASERRVLLSGAEITALETHIAKQKNCPHVSRCSLP